MREKYIVISKILNTFCFDIKDFTSLTHGKFNILIHPSRGTLNAPRRVFRTRRWSRWTIVRAWVDDRNSRRILRKYLWNLYRAFWITLKIRWKNIGEKYFSEKYIIARISLCRHIFARLLKSLFRSVLDLVRIRENFTARHFHSTIIIAFYFAVAHRFFFLFCIFFSKLLIVSRFGGN